MVFLRHRRIQFPLGHGFFHAGRVGVSTGGFIEPDGTYEYVVDCGGPKNVINHQVERYYAKHLDALILTHLHDDHVNGVGTLLKKTGGCDVAIVPYLAPIERLLETGVEF